MYNYDNFGCCLSSVMFNIFEGVLFLRDDFFFLFDDFSVNDFCWEISKKRKVINKCDIL